MSPDSASHPSTDPHAAGTSMDRRTFLRSAAGGAVATTFAVGGSIMRGRPAEAATSTARPWLGPAYWANRLQDWRLGSGRKECTAPATRRGLRTVALLTRELVAGDLPAQLTVRTGTLALGAGFSGFLVGVGSGALDYRAAALAQAASGTGGGLLCTYGSDGRVSFREHTDETSQFAYAALPAETGSTGPVRTREETLELRLTVTPVAPGRFDLALIAVDVATGLTIGSGILRDVADAAITGGVALVSSPLSGSACRHWFRRPDVSGSKVALHDERAFRAVVSTLYTVAGGTLKMTAQFMPIGPADPQTAALEFRRAGTFTWTKGPTAAIGPPYVAHFRVSGWDATGSWEYRVVYGTGTALAHMYYGRIAREPAALSVGMLNCTIHSSRPLDQSSSVSTPIAGGHDLGLYTTANLYFPYAPTVRNLARLEPDLLVALGDQFYEHRPTKKEWAAAPTLDFLYKYYLWLWSFRELTANTPCVVLVDDHDVYQGNIWGHSGAPAPNGDFRQGGYAKDPAWVNGVQSAQCWHNPDPYDPTPVQQGLSVYYGTFTYGGVSFAVLEDRKFKTGDNDGQDAAGLPFPAAGSQLLGSRQENLLAAWAASSPGLPKVCLTQSMFACLQTTLDGLPAVDYDSNGYPAAGRATALQLLRSAHALVLCGDQHLGAVVRHGVSSFTDGPVQFMAPALGAGYSRWFEPATMLPNSSGEPHTGDFTDGFGNHVRVLAVANPVVTRRDFVTGFGTSSHDLGDRTLKREGYGIVRLDHAARTFVLECWSWDADHSAGAPQQFPGWPVAVGFADV